MRTVAFVVAIVLGVVAVIGIGSYAKSLKRQYEQEHKMVNVALARRSIKQGEALSRDMVGYDQRPAEMLSGLSITSLALPSYLDREVNRNIDRGTQILVSDFARREPERPATVLQEGMRAVSISVNPTSGVAGLLSPGDSVDILATMTVPGGAGAGRAGTAKTWVVLSDVTVLAVDERTSGLLAGPVAYAAARRGYSTLTLAVTPEEALILVYLQEHATLIFALRPRLEVGERSDLSEVELSNVMALAEEANRKRQRRIEAGGTAPRSAE